MATYRCLADLQGNTLKHGDIVILKDIEYTTLDGFLSCDDTKNDKIFKDLKISKVDIAKQAYGYPSMDGRWPECKRGDYSALTRLVVELYKIIEGETSASSEKKQWYKITSPGKTGITPEQVKTLIIRYGGLLNLSFDYTRDLGVYAWTQNERVQYFYKYEVEKDAIEVYPEKTAVTTIKQKEKHENQFQRKKARIERGTRPEGSTVCGRRSKASVTVGHLGYRKVTGI